MKKNSNIKKTKSHDCSDDSNVGVKNAENKKRLTFDMPVSLHRELKIYSVKSGKTMGEIINQLLEEKMKKTPG